MKVFCTFWFVLVFTFQVKAQAFDTLRVMTYNLTYYGETTSFCTSSNNVITEKDANLKTICKHVVPDVLVVNEMGASNVYANRILANVLNTGGIGYYEKCPIQNNSFSDLVNGVFYNTNKLTLIGQSKVSKDMNNQDIVRVIDVNRFYYNDPELSSGGDTVFFYVAAVHLKAGSSASDEADRESAAEALMDWIATRSNEDYFMLCGDLNLKGSSEGAFQQLSTASFPLLDPINETGNWYNNSQFAAIHTQSTRTDETNSGCFSGGGLDDRFDLILMTEPVLQDTGDVSYVQDTYRTIGQDGNHFNLPINNVPNNSEPASVIAALYAMSDHLPVTADIKVRLNEKSDTASSVTEISESKSIVTWFQQGELRIQNNAEIGEGWLYNLNGTTMFQFSIDEGFNAFPLVDIPAGVYIVRTQNERGIQIAKIWISR